MRILQKPLKAKKGDLIEITFSKPTMVKLLSEGDFRKYKRGKTHKYYGGWQEQSPVTFTVPEGGLWHAVIEKGTYYNPIDVEGNAFIVTDQNKINAVKQEAPKAIDEPDEPADEMPEEVTEQESSEEDNED